MKKAQTPHSGADVCRWETPAVGHGSVARVAHARQGLALILPAYKGFLAAARVVGIFFLTSRQLTLLHEFTGYRVE